MATNNLEGKYDDSNSDCVLPEGCCFTPHCERCVFSAALDAMTPQQLLDQARVHLDVTVPDQIRIRRAWPLLAAAMMRLRQLLGSSAEDNSDQSESNE